MLRTGMRLLVYILLLEWMQCTSCIKHLSRPEHAGQFEFGDCINVTQHTSIIRSALQQRRGKWLLLHANWNQRGTSS